MFIVHVPSFEFFLKFESKGSSGYERGHFFSSQKLKSTHYKSSEILQTNLCYPQNQDLSITLSFSDNEEKAIKCHRLVATNLFLYELYITHIYVYIILAVSCPILQLVSESHLA